MTSINEYLFQLIVQTLKDPKGAAREITAIELSKPILWNMVLLVVILSVLLTYGTVILLGQDVLLLALVGSPMVFALLMFSQMVLLIFAVSWAGKAMGGDGRLEDFAVLIAWLQFMWLVAQVFQIILLMVSPTTATFFGMISILYGLWIISNFIAVAHGFPSAIKGAGVLAMSVIGVIAGLSLLLSLIGFGTLGLSVDV